MTPNEKQRRLGCRVPTGKVVSVSFNSEACRKALVKMIIKDELSFNFVEGGGFLEFMSLACPNFKVPSRRTLARDILQLYENEKRLLKNIICANRQRVCITTDIWTSIQMSNYMLITAHFIDKNWVLHKRILSFVPLSSHKGEAIGKLIEASLIEWGVESVFTVSMDNTSANDKAVSYLKKKMTNWGQNSMVLNGLYLHVRCSAHIVNLIVKSGLDIMKSSIDSVRSAVKYVRSSPSRLQMFKSCVDAEKITYSGFMVLDVPTRWNSTFLMLRSALKFERAFERLKDEDGHFISWFGEDEDDESVKGKVGPPVENDWENVRRLVQSLRIFYEVTLELSSTKFVTANIYWNEMLKIHFHLRSLEKGDDCLLSLMAKPMIAKFEKYWGANFEKVNLLLILASVLDPRCKMEFVIFCFKDLYESEKVEELVGGIRELLGKLFEDYNLSEGDPKSIAKSNYMVQFSDIFSESGGACSSVDAFSQFKKMKECTQNEVDRYLSDKAEPMSDQFDILGWWRLNWHRYLTLSEIAKDIMAIPVSTMTSESAFSTEERILDAFRSSLTPKTVESLICTQNWLKSSFIRDPIVEPIEEEIQFYEVVEEEFLKLMQAQQSQANDEQMMIL